MERKWLKEVQALQELRKNKGASSPAFKKGVDQLNHLVFRELCDKPYQTECDLERILSYALAFYGGMIYGLFLAVLWRVV